MGFVAFERISGELSISFKYRGGAQRGGDAAILVNYPPEGLASPYLETLLKRVPAAEADDKRGTHGTLASRETRRQRRAEMEIDKT